MRNSCIDCTCKHLAQASVLADEALNYPHHKDLAIGHMAEAESESRKEYPNLANAIRMYRCAWINNNEEPDFDYLLRHARISAGEKLVYSEDNSKVFASLY